MKNRFIKYIYLVHQEFDVKPYVINNFHNTINSSGETSKCCMENIKVKKEMEIVSGFGYDMYVIQYSSNWEVKCHEYNWEIQYFVLIYFTKKNLSNSMWLV